MSSLTPMIRQRAKPVIGDGNLVYDEDWSDPEILRFEGYLYSRSSVDSAASEPRDQGTVSDKQLIVPNHAIDIKVHDRIIINGDTWRVTEPGGDGLCEEKAKQALQIASATAPVVTGNYRDSLYVEHVEFKHRNAWQVVSSEEDYAMAVEAKHHTLANAMRRVK